MKFNKQSYQRIIATLHDGLYFVDRDRQITYWNRSAEKISGFMADEVVGRRCSDNILSHMDAEGNCLCLDRCPLAFTMEDGQPREAVVYMHHRDGHRVPVSVRTSALTDENGVIVGGVELFTDISGLGANELRVQELEKLALLDNLTRLANRRYLERELQNHFEEKKRLAASFGVLFMDIDLFKQFNDTYGHDVGDEVLKFVANTLVTNSRPFDLYGRWGGEEFIGIIRNCTTAELEVIGNRVRLLIEHAYLIHQGQELRVTVSMGATLFRDGDTLETMIKRADTLMYESKREGRNRLTIG